MPDSSADRDAHTVAASWGQRHSTSRRRSWMHSGQSEADLEAAVEALCGAKALKEREQEGVFRSANRQPTAQGLQKLPTNDKALAVLAGEITAEVALPWIHALATSVREDKAAADAAREQRQLELKRKVRAAAMGSGAFVTDLERRRAAAAAAEEQEKLAAERKARRLRREQKLAARNKEEKRRLRLRGIYT
jgi:hypothetical protein